MKYFPRALEHSSCSQPALCAAFSFCLHMAPVCWLLSLWPQFREVLLCVLTASKGDKHTSLHFSELGLQMNVDLCYWCFFVTSEPLLPITPYKVTKKIAHRWLNYFKVRFPFILISKHIDKYKITGCSVGRPYTTPALHEEAQSPLCRALQQPCSPPDLFAIATVRCHLNLQKYMAAVLRKLCK